MVENLKLSHSGGWAGGRPFFVSTFLSPSIIEAQADDTTPLATH
jgi:hypothetical protein